ncbi:MAG: SDR family oxidoreductase [Hyphomicrobiales bacterium]|nr:SDR family oxidoreductase [Hyphomicrobiales bacterium]
MTRLLDGKTALITGAAGGFGAECARLFHRNGAKVTIADIATGKAGALAEELGDGAKNYRLDVSDQQNFQACIDATVEAFGRLDILVNNAAKILPGLAVNQTEEADFDAFVSINLKGTYNGMKLAYPHLKKSTGCVLNISSMSGVVGQANHAIYAATKGGINALTKATAVDWGHDGIRVNALCPLAMWTDGLRAWLDEQVDPQAMVRYLDSLSSLNYTPEAEEVAGSAVYLCSDLAKFVTGVVLPVSGGGEVGYKISG